MTATFAELMDEARDYVPFDEVWYRYMALVTAGVSPEDAIRLAYERALEFQQTEAMR
jgi:hypothetical protein